LKYASGDIRKQRNFTIDIDYGQAWLRSALLIAEIDGKPIQSPSALLTWKVRQFVG